jgi:hypothetical protein
LRLRWLLNKWADGSMPWVRGNLCTPSDHDLFLAATVVTNGNRENALFWGSDWLNGIRPKDTTPKIFELAKRKKKRTLQRALENDFWVSHLNTQGSLSLEHIMQFYKLWEMLQHLQLDMNTPDTIAWKFGKDGSYSASSAYKMQFLVHTPSLMPSMVWKPWHPLKCNIFVWLVLQDRVWTVDWFHKSGWPNCGQCVRVSMRTLMGIKCLFIYLYP